jgi:hypothetical protein
MNFQDFLPFAIIITFLALVSIFVFRKTKDEKEEEAALRARLDDAFLYDAESGKKLSLEELENDEIVIDEAQLNRIKTEEEINQFFQEEDRILELLLNELKRKGFGYKDFTELELDQLGKTLLLTQYDDWSYTRPYFHSIRNIRVCFVNVENYYTSGKNSGSHSFNQLVYWVQNKSFTGHIYFREKTAIDKFMGLFEHQDEISINEFLGTAIVPSPQQDYILSRLSELLLFNDIDLEQIGENLYVKTQKIPTREECEAHFLALEKAQKGDYYSRTQI